MRDVSDPGLDDLWTCASQEALDRTVALARRSLGASLAVLSSFEDQQRVLRGVDGLASCFPSNDLCASVVATGEPKVLSGATAYLGVPIRRANGQSIGTICVVSNDPRDWSQDDVDVLHAIASTLVDQIEIARQLKDLAQSDAKYFADMVDMNHELRIPLQTIASFTEFLKTETRRDQILAHIRTIQAAADSATAIVRNILDQAVGTNGANTGDNRASTDIRALAETALNMVGPLAVRKGLDSRLVIREGVPAVAVLDHQRVLQALLNILQNAVTFTAHGSFTLDIAPSGDGLRFSVSDTGVGVDADKRERIFQRMSRLDQEPQPVHGDGIGLAITKALIDALGGTIGVNANPKGGTTFWFDIPKVDEGTLEPSQVPSRRTTEGTGTIRILIADDLDLNRKLIADMLAIDGHNVDCVADGAAAVTAARENVYDLILMDMIMPGMDGPTAARTIRALPAPACDVPILALTANCGKEQLDSCLAAGMNATLIKPMTFEDLSAAVTTWVSRQSEAA